MPLRLPTVEFMTADLAGKVAAPAAVAGADVIPWRPALGVYLLIEQGQAPGDALADVPGVAGVWWYHGNLAPAPYATDARGMQITYCYLDDDPVATAERLGRRGATAMGIRRCRRALGGPFPHARSVRLDPPSSWRRRP